LELFEGLSWRIAAQKRELFKFSTEHFLDFLKDDAVIVLKPFEFDKALGVRNAS